MFYLRLSLTRMQKAHMKSDINHLIDRLGYKLRQVDDKLLSALKAKIERLLTEIHRIIFNPPLTRTRKYCTIKYIYFIVVIK